MARSDRIPAPRMIVKQLCEIFAQIHTGAPYTLQTGDRYQGKRELLLEQLAKMTMTVSQTRDAVRELTAIVEKAKRNQQNVDDVQSAIDSLKRDYHLS